MHNNSCEVKRIEGMQTKWNCEIQAIRLTCLRRLYEKTNLRCFGLLLEIWYKLLRSIAGSIKKIKITTRSCYDCRISWVLQSLQTYILPIVNHKNEITLFHWVQYGINQIEVPLLSKWKWIIPLKIVLSAFNCLYKGALDDLMRKRRWMDNPKVYNLKLSQSYSQN